MVVQSYQFKIANHTVKPIRSIVWPQVHALAGPTAGGGGGAPVLAATPTVQEDVAGPPAPAPFPKPPPPPSSHHKKAIPQVTDTCSQPPVLGEHKTNQSGLALWWSLTLSLLHNPKIKKKVRLQEDIVCEI